jgi:hypothetical protein
MRAISSLCIVLSVASGIGAWEIAKPLLVQNGSSVIAVMSDDGKSGGKPATIKLPDNLTQKQYGLLNFAYQVAKEDGVKNPQYLQGVLFQESKLGQYNGYQVAGLTNKPGDRYFGIGQIKLAAAKAVVLQYPDLWKYLNTHTDEELEAKLILDDQFNIRVASKYLLMMGINKDPTFAITAYNQGLGGAQQVDPSTHPYTVDVKKHAAALEKVKLAS